MTVATPECVVLPARGGSPRGAVADRTPVRIFLASEPAQWRAERVFVWSVERARDPQRRYEIHLLKSLPGFRTRGWTTGFTNYRFAIPELCGARGRAIYNDVDQVYTADPGQLFDLDLAGHGFLAVAPDDPSVMLIDCARMAAFWTLARARRESKRRLLARALARPGLYGPLDPSWNARDDELPPGAEKCLHFTTLHTQPWRPFPERFAYQPNPRGEVWHALERSADAAGFRVFDRERPSTAYATWHARHAADAAATGGEAEDGAPYAPPAPGAPATPVAPQRTVGAWLATLPENDLPWVLDDLFSATRDEVRLSLPWDGDERSAARWRERLDAAAAGAPKLAWRLTLRAANGRGALREGGCWRSANPPRVWVLLDDRPGNQTQSLGLAQALGWPFEAKALRLAPASRLHNRLLGASRRGIDTRRSSPLVAPWPDLVIAAGRRTAPVALWIREQSQGRTRLVMLGRKAADDAERFDLCVTPAYCRLPAHPRRLETRAPLHRVTREALDAARAQYATRFGPLPAPRIALLFGGTSGQYAADAASARRIGAEALAMARAAGGSLLVTTSRRLGPRATAALREAVAGAAFVHAWSPEDAENPYLGLLAWADAFVVTGDSESMLAETCSLGRGVYVAPLPVRRSFRVLARLREAVWRRAQGAPPGPRGTPRPQRGLERACARALERGWVRPSRDLERLHRDLFERGLARPLGAPGSAEGPAAASTDREQVVARVRALLGCAADRAPSL